MTTQYGNLYGAGGIAPSGLYGRKKQTGGISGYYAGAAEQAAGGKQSYLLPVEPPAKAETASVGTPGAGGNRPVQTDPVLEPVRGDRTTSVVEDGEKKTGVTSGELSYYDDILGKLDKLYGEGADNGDTLYYSRLKSARDQLQQQRDAVNLNYDDIAKQLYIDRKMQEKRTPQQLAAMGYTGGLSESSLLDIGHEYEQNLLNNEKERARALEELEYNYGQAELEAEQEREQTRSSNAQNYFSLYAQIMAQAKADEDQKAADELAKYQSMLAYLSDLGITPTAQQLVNAYGISQEEAAALLAGIPSAGYYGSLTGGNLTGDSPAGDLTGAGNPSDAQGANPGEQGYGRSGNLLNVPGYGEISYEDAERLENAGLIELVGIDASGNPIFRRTTRPGPGNINMTR